MEEISTEKLCAHRYIRILQLVTELVRLTAQIPQEEADKFSEYVKSAMEQKPSEG
jgi:hypothetical protein